MYGLIYKITNDVNPYCYIGQTITSLSHRWSEHKQSINDLKKNNKLYTAMRQIGLNHFKISIIEEFSDISEEELDQKEQYWIEYFDSFYNGYNSTKGGTFGSRNIKAILCYTLSGKFYKRYETVQKASVDLGINYDSIIIYLSNQEQESCGGFQFKYENSNRIIKNFSDLKDFTAKKLFWIQYDLNGKYLNHFLSVKEASERTGCLESGIVRCAKKQLKYTNNFIWRIGFLGEEIPKIIEMAPITNTKKGISRKIIHINKEGKQIYYKSLSEAAKQTNRSRHQITHNCDIYPKSTLNGEWFKYAEK